MDLKIALSGPSGSGKTTLAKIIQRNYKESTGEELRFISTSARDIIPTSVLDDLKENYGYKGRGHKEVISLSNSNPEFGRAFQEEVLKARSALIDMQGPFIMDRSPLDNWVYYLHQASAFQDYTFSEAFLGKCKQAYNKLSHVILVQTIKDNEVEDNNSRVDNIYFQRCVNSTFVNEHKDHFADEVLGKETQDADGNVILQSKPLFREIDFWDLSRRERVVSRFINM